MKLLLYKYLCSSCNTSFKSPGISGEIYGEFLMRSEKSGEPAYLNACLDNVFTEVGKLFDEVIVFENTKIIDDSDIFQSIFSVSCDLSVDGSNYRIGLMPLCPNCDSRKMASWGPVKPFEYMNRDINIISHNKWNKFTYEEKKALVKEAVEKYLLENK